MLALAFALRWLAFDRRTALLIFSAAIFYYFNFYHTSWTDFTLDAGVQADYIRKIVARAGLLPNFTNPVAHHPPTYYIAAALLYKLASLTDTIDPMMTVRHLSMALYLIFILLAVLTLRRFFTPANLSYNAVLLLLLFWPVGVTMAARINCDVLHYVGQMGTIYSLVRWLQERRIGNITNAFLFAGVGLLSKNAGIVLLGFSLCMVVHAGWMYRRQLGTLLNIRLFASVLFAFACAYITLHRSWMGDYIHEDVPVERGFITRDIVHSFLLFDPVLFLNESIFNLNQGESEIRFWHWFLRSAILGDFMTWRALSVVFPLGVIWLCMLAYMLYGLRSIQSLTQAGKTMFYCLTSVVILFIASMMVMRYVSPLQGYADARYIYPVVTLFVIAYGKVMEWHLRAGRSVLFRIGNGLALGFLLLSIALFVAQHLLLTHICCSHD